MTKPFLAAILLALSTSVTFAADDGDLSTKAMKAHPGTMGGSTSNATAKPNSGSLSEKQMQEQPGVNMDKTGSTAMPNAKPADGSISNKEMEDNAAAHK